MERVSWLWLPSIRHYWGGRPSTSSCRCHQDVSFMVSFRVIHYQIATPESFDTLYGACMECTYLWVRVVLLNCWVLLEDALFSHSCVDDSFLTVVGGLDEKVYTAPCAQWFGYHTWWDIWWVAEYWCLTGITTYWDVTIERQRPKSTAVLIHGRLNTATMLSQPIWCLVGS
jgi:hypothetical protein